MLADSGESGVLRVRTAGVYDPTAASALGDTWSDQGPFGASAPVRLSERVIDAGAGRYRLRAWYVTVREEELRAAGVTPNEGDLWVRTATNEIYSVIGIEETMSRAGTRLILRSLGEIDADEEPDES